MSFRSTKQEFGGLSNMAGGYPLRVGDILVPSAEALYQSCRFPHAPQIQQKIIDQKSPMTAKMVSKPHRHVTRPDWMQIRVRVMRWVLRVKLAEHWSRFGDLLFQTDDRPIVEDSRKDPFWGALREADDTLVGMNVLGRLLMELREELKGHNRDALGTVAPPPITEFLLLGRPIGTVTAERQPYEAIDPDVAPATETLWGTSFADSSAAATSTPLHEADAALQAPTSDDRMTRYPKRLIEVDLPIARISAHARREKSIRHGHISTLHIWWARRPLAACRAVICAALWPDPVDELCPQRFRDDAARILADLREQVLNGKLSDDQRAARDPVGRIQVPTAAGDHPGLRRALLDFIAEFANWDLSTNRFFLDASRALTKSAHEALGGAPGTRPLVVDPFAGGGSIPLEALRIGADAFASDLNPIPVLLNKVVLEYIPKYGQKLADEVRKWGRWVKERAEEELAEFYPKDPDGATPIAYLWARTILSEAPGQGSIPVEIPLMRSLWLAKKANRKRALRWVRDDNGQVKTKTVEVAYCIDGKPTPTRVKQPILEIFEPKKDSEVDAGTVARGSATCPVTGHTTPVASVRKQLKQRRGGAADARLFTVVTTRANQQGRFYRLPTERDQSAFEASAVELATRLKLEGAGATQRSQVLTRAGGGTVKHTNSTANVLSMVPDEPTPLGGGRGAGRAFSQRNYGMDYFADLFSPRQLLALTTLARRVREAGARAAPHDSGLAEAVQAILALAHDKLTALSSSVSPWSVHAECPLQIFGRQAIAMLWDFAEGMPTGDSSGSFATLLVGIPHALDQLGCDWNTGAVDQADATNHPMPNDSATAFITDPPYYDAVPYSDLSDFFYVWLKRTLPPILGAAFVEPLTPKDAECIVDDAKGKDAEFFERTMTEAMREGRRVARPDGVGMVVFAHKSTAGWESQLAAMIEAGWVISGSWPIDTEYGSRMRAQDSAALASSVHIVMRPREHPDGSVREDDIGEWREVLGELPGRMHAWMPRLAAEGVVGADAIFACLGPALEIFSRYSRVEKASGEVVTLGEFLEQVWAAVSKEALSMLFADADASGLEPDARLTAMWLWTLGAGAGVQAATTKGAAKAVAEGDTEDDTDEAGDDGESGGKKSKSTAGFGLDFDAARKIAQGLGAHLDKLPTVVEVKGDKARLLSVAERTRHLFGKDAEADQPRGRRKKKSPQMNLFEELEAVEEMAESGGWALGGMPLGQTTLDRIHQAMILFAAGRGEALKRFLVDDGAGKDARFWKLAQSLSALYPTGTDEKRWVDGVLGRKKGLGL